jgi:hypothetical protein
MTPADDVLNDCIAVFPSFRDYWAENGWYFQDENGKCNACGVFLLLTWLIFERFKRVSDRQWQRLGRLAKKHFDLGEPTQGMLGACLIEHLEGREFSAKVLRYFDRDMLRHYHFSGAEAGRGRTGIWSRKSRGRTPERD